MDEPPPQSFQVDLRQLFHESPQVVLIVGDGGRIEYANTAASNWYGYSNDELLCMGVEHLAPPMLKGQVPSRLKMGIATGETFEWTHRTKAGIDLPVEIHTQPIRFQGRDVRLAIIRDLTLRRATIEHDRLQSAIVDTMAHGIVLTSVATTEIVFINPVFEAMLGYQSKELVGRPVSVINAPTEITPEQVAMVINDALVRDGSWRGEVKNQRKDGKPIWCYYVVTTFDHWQFGPVWLGVCTDVSEARQTRLERDYAMLGLNKALLEKESLIREVHHRVKNNLQVVTSLLRMEFSRSTALETRSALKEMQGRVGAMAMLHESLYRSSNLAAVDLGDYLRQLARQTFLSHALAPDDIELQIDVTSCMVGQDRAIPIGLILNEWISNALKHAFPLARRGTLCVSLHSTGEHDRYCLSVRDSGVGFPADFQSRRDGTLGMQLIDALCGQIEGTLSVDSIGDVGTTLQLTFETQMADHAPK